MGRAGLARTRRAPELSTRSHPSTCPRNTAGVMEAVRLDPAEVAAAVRSLLVKETERGDDPRFIPEDRAGWHALKPIAPDAAGAPYYEPESWRWFDLVDVGYVDEMVLIVFRWTDPSTPALRYCYLAHADGLPDAGAAALIVRSQLRQLLEPGWRDRVKKRWLSHSKVLVWLDRNRDDQPVAVRDRRAKLEQDLHDAAWTASRRTDAD